MYNLKNEDDFYYIHQLIISNKLIPFYNQFIHAPTVDELLQMKPNEYNKLIFPFSLSLDCFTDSKDANILDCIYLSCINEINNNKPCLVDDLIKGISFFLKIDKSLVNPVVFVNHIEIHIGRDIVTGFYLKQLHKEDFENKEHECTSPDPIMNKRLQEFYKGRREYFKNKKSKENKIGKLYNIYSYVANSLSNYEKVLNYNIFQLYETFNYLQSLYIEDFDMHIATSGYANEGFKPRNILQLITK